MQGKLYLIPANPNKPMMQKIISSPPSFEELQKLVGGYIEEICGFDTFIDGECVAFCNEDGEELGLAENYRASMLWALKDNPADLIASDMLLGNVVIVSGDHDFMRAL